jgi:DNA-directed RNA polymerase subunit RPC12/RpoP
MPIILFRIEGGYGKEPRWSDVVRRGKMKAYVSRVIYPEEYAPLSNDELFEIIKNELYVDEAKIDAEFHHRKSAEYLERAIYVCPFCGLSTFESHGDTVECKKCGLKIRYLPTKELQCNNREFPFRFVADWYDYQIDFMNDLDITAYRDQPIYQDSAMISEVIPCKKKLRISDEAKIDLYCDRIVVADENNRFLFPFDEATAVTVLGKNKLNVYHNDKIYQFKGNKRFNALKYVHLYHRYQNIIKGDNNVKFLGL